MDKKDYKNVFVFAEQRYGVIQPVALELLGKARDLADALGEKVVAMLLGEGIKDQAQMLIEQGADEVIVVDAPELKDFLSEQYSQLSARSSWTASPASCSMVQPPLAATSLPASLRASRRV